MDNEEFIYQLRVALHKYMVKNFATAVISAELNSNQPAKPFATCKSYLINDETQNATEEEVTLRTFNSYGLPPGEYRKRYVYQKINLSFTVWDKGADNRGNLSSQRLAEEMRKWFHVYAQPLLDDTGSVIVQMSNVQDRTTFLVDSYDYKSGFDVTLRRTNEQFFVPLYQSDKNGVNYDTIETVIINDKAITIDNKEEK